MRGISGLVEKKKPVSFSRRTLLRAVSKEVWSTTDLRRHDPVTCRTHCQHSWRSTAAKRTLCVMISAGSETGTRHPSVKALVTQTYLSQTAENTATSSSSPTSTTTTTTTTTHCIRHRALFLLFFYNFLVRHIGHVERTAIYKYITYTV